MTRWFAKGTTMQPFLLPSAFFSWCKVCAISISIVPGKAFFFCWNGSFSPSFSSISTFWAFLHPQGCQLFLLRFPLPLLRFSPCLVWRNLQRRILFDLELWSISLKSLQSTTQTNFCNFFRWCQLDSSPSTSQPRQCRDMDLFLPELRILQNFLPHHWPRLALFPSIRWSFSLIYGKLHHCMHPAQMLCSRFVLCLHQQVPAIVVPVHQLLHVILPL